MQTAKRSDEMDSLDYFLSRFQEQVSLMEFTLRECNLSTNPVIIRHFIHELTSVGFANILKVQNDSVKDKLYNVFGVDAHLAGSCDVTCDLTPVGDVSESDYWDTPDEARVAARRAYRLANDYGVSGFLGQVLTISKVVFAGGPNPNSYIEAVEQFLTELPTQHLELCASCLAYASPAQTVKGE